jgi:hypothetical protein
MTSLQAVVWLVEARPVANFIDLTMRRKGDADASLSLPS